MLSRLKLFVLLVFVADLILLGVLVHYTSWLFVLGFVFISGILGVWLLNDGLRLYMRKSGRALNGNAMQVDHFLIGAAAHLAAGVLFIVPGALTDLIALLLLTPMGKRLARIFITSLFGKIFSHLSNGISSNRSSGVCAKGDSPIFDDAKIGTVPEKPAKDEIIDVRVANAGEEEPENGR
jgi:UPF0716 protein FxsA